MLTPQLKASFPHGQWEGGSLRSFIGAASALLLVGASAPATERVVSGDGVVSVTINGAPGKLRIDPAAPGLLLMTADYAARADLKGGGLLGFGVAYVIGTERVVGRTQVTRIDWAPGIEKNRVGWTPRPFAEGADAAIGPAGVPERIVRFDLRPPRPGERMVTLPMTGNGLFGGWFASTATIEVGGEPLTVGFDPRRPRSIANAGAGKRLAALFGGTLSGQATPAIITFGIARPVRTLTLDRPFPIGHLQLSALAMRVADGGSIRDIPEADAPKGDPDEVVVVAKGKHDPKRDRLMLGADALSGCSSILFDKPAQQIRLSCS
jgi:hypothetical protein